MNENTNYPSLLNRVITQIILIFIKSRNYSLGHNESLLNLDTVER